MSTPVNPSTEKVYQDYFPLSLKPSNEQQFPIAYADALWDVAIDGSALAALAEGTGQFDQHTVNELFAQAIASFAQALDVVWHSIQGQPQGRRDFSDDFSDDFA